MRVLALLLFALLPFVGNADSWSYPPELNRTEYTFGATRIVKIIDARENQQYPHFQVDVYTDGELVGRYGGHSFEHIAASENNEVFVAISNDGLPSTAIMIFDAQGNLRVLINHDSASNKLTYCSRSVTLEREWFDPEDPSLGFVESDDGNDIEVRGCNGEMLSIVELIA